MNTLKFISLLAIMFVLTSCSKEGPNEEPIEEKVMCDQVTLTVNNLLPKDIEEFTIGNVNFGTIPANGSEVLCLEESLGYSPTPNFLVLFASAIYDNEEVYDGFFCGTGLVAVTEGAFEMDITEINENLIFYSFE